MYQLSALKTYTIIFYIEIPFQRYKFYAFPTPGAQVMASARLTLNHRRSIVLGKSQPFDEFHAPS
jgi:hypothetical protein